MREFSIFLILFLNATDQKKICKEKVLDPLFEASNKDSNFF